MFERGDVAGFYYLWHREAQKGEESGRKRRRVCTVIKSPGNILGDTKVDLNAAGSKRSALKRPLPGLISARSQGSFKMNAQKFAQIAMLASDREQATEHYLAARDAIDPDHPDERAFLQDLSRALQLPEVLVSHLDAQGARDQEV